MSVQVVEIPVDKCDPSPWQPRTHFDENYLNELAESIKLRGVIQPITVRLINGRYQIVVGECRWRSSHKAGKKTVPAMVREMSDADAAEIALIENLQRADLDILEEAQGYASALRLKDDKGEPRYTPDSLAQRINKSPHHVGQYLSLLTLPAEAINALRAGEISFSVARLLARVPGDKMKARAVEAVLHPQFEEEALNARQTEELLSREFMRKLAGAPFDQNDANLVPIVKKDGVRCMGGACADCPFKTGNNPEEFGVAPAGSGHQGSRVGARGVQPDICTHLECFGAKADAAWEEEKSAALKAGKRVLSQEDADKLFPYHNSGELHVFSNYVELSAQLPREILVDPNQKRVPSWKKALSGAEVQPEVMVVRDPKGRARELVDRRQAEAALKLAAKKDGAAPIIKAGARSGSGMSDEEKKQREKKKLDMAIAHLVMTELANEIQRRGLVGGFWRALRGVAWLRNSADGFWMIGNRIGADPVKVSGSGRDYETAIESSWENEVDDKTLAARVVELLFANGLRWSGIETEGFGEFLELYGIDKAPLIAKAKAEVGEKKKASSKKKAEKPTAPPKKKAAKSEAAEQPPAPPAEKNIQKTPESFSVCIVEALKAGPADGMTAREIATKIQAKSQNVHVWFATTGAKREDIKKGAAGKYQLIQEA